jgi:hypothetical protein
MRRRAAWFVEGRSAGTRRDVHIDHDEGDVEIVVYNRDAPRRRASAPDGGRPPGWFSSSSTFVRLKPFQFSGGFSGFFRAEPGSAESVTADGEGVEESGVSVGSVRTSSDASTQFESPPLRS